MVRNPFRQAASVDEYQRRAVLEDERSQPIVDLLPAFGGHHRLERRVEDLDGQIEVAGVTCVDDDALWRAISPQPACADEKAGDLFDRSLGRGQPDADQ